MKIRKLLLFITLFLTIKSFAQTSPSYVPTSGLVGWWSFTGNANDESGNNNNGTTFGVVLNNDRNDIPNSSYQFDGIDDYISITPSSTLDFSQGLTISVWNKITSVTTGSNNLSAFLVSRDNDTSDGHFHLAYDKQSTSITGGQHYQGSLKYSLNSVYTSTALTYPQSQWHHTVMTYDNSQLKIYLDGNLSNTVLLSVPIESLTSNILLGKHLNSSYPYLFKGLMDDLGIWNRALNPQEITDLFSSTLSSQDFYNETKAIVYPNPFNDEIRISLSDNQNYSIKIINPLGQELKSFKMNNQESIVSLSELNSGVYIVNFYNSENKLVNSKKIIKK